MSYILLCLSLNSIAFPCVTLRIAFSFRWLSLSFLTVHGFLKVSYRVLELSLISLCFPSVLLRVSRLSSCCGGMVFLGFPNLPWFPRVYLKFLRLSLNSIGFIIVFQDSLRFTLGGPLGFLRESRTPMELRENSKNT